MSTGSRGPSPLVITLVCVIAVLSIAIAAVGWLLITRDSTTPHASAITDATVTVTAEPSPTTPPTPATTAAPALSYNSFRSADGAVRCEIGTRMAGSWGGRDQPDVGCLASPFHGSSTPTASCSSNISHLKGAAALMHSGPVLVGLCTGGQPWANPSPTPPSLQPGESTALSGITCTAVTPSSISCRTGAGRGFTLSSMSLSTTPSA